MANFAELDKNNVVQRILVVHNNELIENGIELEDKGISFLKSIFGQDTKWIKTSYNTKGNKYYNPDGTLGDQSKAFRKNYPAQGDIYDPIEDGFHTPKPYSQWLLNKDSFLWYPPFPMPERANIFSRIGWSEQYGSWIKEEYLTEIDEENREIVVVVNGIKQEKPKKLWNNQLLAWEDII